MTIRFDTITDVPPQPFPAIARQEFAALHQTLFQVLRENVALNEKIAGLQLLLDEQIAVSQALAKRIAALERRQGEHIGLAVAVPESPQTAQEGQG